MAATPAEMRLGIAANLTAGLGAANVQISAYRLPMPMDICIQIIGTDEVEYDQTMQRGLDYWTFQVQALAGSPISQQAQTLLDTWKNGAGTSSVKVAIESDRTLGGKVQDLTVERAGPDQIYTPKAGAELLGCIFTVLVLNTGK